MAGMFWIAATIGFALLPGASVTPPQRAETLRVSARVLRSAEANAERLSRHDATRVREVVERLPDGRDIRMVIFDFE